MKHARNIRILSVSDVVTPLDDLQADDAVARGIDLLLSCGDLPPEYLTSLVSAFRKPLYYVCGNHDIRYHDSKPQGGVNLHGRLISARGVRLLGLAGSIWYNGGPCQYKEAQMRSIIRRLRPTLWWNRGVDIVITHAPPRGIHDQPDQCHTGFQSFRWLIEKYRPSYFIHGHIHRDFDRPENRITVVNRTSVVNTYGYFVLEVKIGKTDPSGESLSKHL